MGCHGGVGGEEWDGRKIDESAVGSSATVDGKEAVECGGGSEESGAEEVGGALSAHDSLTHATASSVSSALPTVDEEHDASSVDSLASLQNENVSTLDL